jgi:hypothetical protein
MRVELAAGVFTADTPEPGEINAVARLLAAFDEGRHDWVVDFETVPDIADYLEKHQPTLAGAYLSLAEMAAKRDAAWTGTTQAGKLLLVSPAEVADHASDLCRAAVVVVENTPADEHFLLAVIHAFRADRVQEAIEQGWVEFRHGGGSGSLPAVAEAEAARFRRSIRVIAVFDSDSLTPEHEGPNRPKAERLRNKQILAHVLLLREAENYAPYRVLAELGRRPEAAARIKQLKRLHPRQRGHYDMKKGFTKPVKPEQRGFFDDLDTRARQVLHQGFGDAVLEQMFTMRDKLSEADFEALNAGAAADLRTLLALIDSLI